MESSRRQEAAHDLDLWLGSSLDSPSLGQNSKSRVIATEGRRQLGAEYEQPQAQTTTPLNHWGDIALRLFDETYISWPSDECLSKSSDEGAAASTEADPSQQQQLCLLSNWTSARLVDANGTTFWPTTRLHSHQDPHSTATLYNQLTTSQSAPRASPNVQLAGLLYISASSLVALVGIVTNLLILMIIVINTKQKCHSFLSRTSQTGHTNYHYVLLFQLTLTGLLLGSYVLYSNTSALSSGGAGAGGSQATPATPGDHLDLRPSLWPLSIYLASQDAREMNLDHGPTRTDGVERVSLLVADLSPAASSTSGKRPLVEYDNQAPMLVQCPSTCLQYEASRHPLDSANPSRMAFDLLAAIHIWTVAALAYDRYCAIAYPLEYLKAINATRAKTFLLVLWCTSLLTVVLLPQSLGLLWSFSSGFNAATPTNSTSLSARLCEMKSGAASQVIEAKVATKQLIWALSKLWPPRKLQQLDCKRGFANEYLLLALSCLTFLLVVLVPLLIVTICNMSIYGIVKGHERRMSASSGGQQAQLGQNGNCNACCVTSAVLCQNFANIAAVASRFRQEASLCSNDEQLHLTNENQTTNYVSKSETCSWSSSIFGKLIKTSAQVGFVGTSIICHDQQSSAASSNSTNDNQQQQQQQRIRQLFEQRGISSRPSRVGGLEHQAAVDSSAASSTKSSFYSTDGRTSPPPSGTLVNRVRARPNGAGGRGSPSALAKGDNKPAKEAVKAPESRIGFLTRMKLKRKLSDKERAAGGGGGSSCQPNVNHVSRKSSLAPSEQTGQQPQQPQQPQQQCLIDACSCHSGQSVSRCQQQQQQQQSSVLSKQSTLDSDGIMRQLKMAGLSFAGIAINELMNSGNSSQVVSEGAPSGLNRFSSCSLGNLVTANNNAATFCANQRQAFTAHAQQAQQHQQADKRSSYVSLSNYNFANFCPQDCKYSTKLVADVDSLDSFGAHSKQTPSLQASNVSTRSSMACHNQHSHFGSGPTSATTTTTTTRMQQFNVAFNVVVWLILILLLCTLPQYSLELFKWWTFDAWQQEKAVGLLRAMVEPASKRGLPDEAELLELASVWLERLCRLLFLSMLPLNAWLYGIRSRSLTHTLKMVLRKYISKKQASIEINQRRKSVMSMRSRDSSIVACTSSQSIQHSNQPLLQQGPSFSLATSGRHQMLMSQQHVRQQELVQGRAFRRCASFNLPPSFGQYQSDQYSAMDERAQERLTRVERGSAASQANEAQRSHSSSIRFVLGDDAAASRQPASVAVMPPTQAPSREFATSAATTKCLTPPMQLNSNFPSQNSSLNSSSLASSNRSLLSASIHSSHSTAMLLLNPAISANLLSETPQTPQSPQTPQTPQASSLSMQPIQGVLKNKHKRPPPPSRGVSMQHQESYDSACSMSSSTTIQQRAGKQQQQPHSKHILARVQSSPGRLMARSQAGAQAQRHSTLIHNVQVQQVKEEGPNHCNAVKSNFSRRASSDIKFLLTSAEEDQHETKLLLEHSDCPLESGGDVKQRPAPAVGQLTGEESDKELATDQQQQQQTRAQIDYFRQIKLAISRYFLTLRRRPSLSPSHSRGPGRRGGGARVVRRCSCCSLGIDDNSPGGTARLMSASVSRRDSDVSQFSYLSGQSSLGCYGTNYQQSLVAAQDFLCECSASLKHDSSIQFQGRHRSSLSTKSCSAHPNNKATRTSSTTDERQQQQQQYMKKPRRKSCIVASSSPSSNQSASHRSHTSNSVPNHHQNIKSSLSIDSLADGSGSSPLRAPQQSQQQQQAQSKQQQSSHLKPPNSLKLIFNPLQANPALYSSSILALSPIKECSSNHSCASSQSSLNIQQQAFAAAIQ